MRAGGTHLLLDEARGAAAGGQLCRVAQRLAHREATQQSVALQEKETSASPQTPAVAGPGRGGGGGGAGPGGRARGRGGGGAGGRGRAHLQDVGEAVLELVPAQRLAVYEHLPEQGPRAPQPPGHGVQQRGFPGAWRREEKALEESVLP